MGKNTPPKQNISNTTIVEADEKQVDQIMWVKDKVIKNALKEAANTYKGKLYIAQHHDQTIGHGAYKAIDENTIYIYLIETYKNYQHLGVATQIMNTIEQNAAKNGYIAAELAVETTNHQAQQLYKKLGYTYLYTYTENWPENQNGKTVTYYALCQRLTKPLKTQT